MEEEKKDPNLYYRFSGDTQREATTDEATVLRREDREGGEVARNLASPS